MSYYRIWDGLLESAIPFPELEETEAVVTPWRNRIIEDDRIHPIRGRAINSYVDASGTCLLSITESMPGFLLHLPGRATFLLPRCVDDDISFAAEKALPRAVLRHQILNVVLPLQQWRRGCFVMHGSAVSVNGKAIAFIGKGGSGKSTLAALLADVWHGRLLADDAIQIKSDLERTWIMPSYNGIRLTPQSRKLLSIDSEIGVFEAYDHKDYLRVGVFFREPVELHAIYFVVAQKAGTPAIRSLMPSESFSGFIGHSFILDPTDPESLAAQFHFVSKLNKLTKSYRFDYIHSSTSLDKSIQLLMEHNPSCF